MYAEVIEGARIRVPVLRSMTRRLLAVLDEVLG
jgi:hypothetical protein